jgi:polyhydroxyalkanoate synthesis regulator phasin
MPGKKPLVQLHGQSSAAPEKLAQNVGLNQLQMHIHRLEEEVEHLARRVTQLEACEGGPEENR